MEAAIKGASKSRANADFRAFLPDLFEPLFNKITGGEDSLAQQVVISAAFTKLAGLRAQVLNGQNPKLVPLKTSSRGSFAWMSKRKTAAGFEARWARIKAADCAAYPVPNCDQRLEQALRQSLAGPLSEAPKVESEEEQAAAIARGEIPK